MKSSWLAACGVFLLAASACALQDANISFDSVGMDLCLAVDNFSYYSCYLNQTISVDGTKDHIYYVIPRPELPEQTGNFTADLKAKARYWFMLPFTFFLSVPTLLFMLLFFVLIVRAVKTWIFG